MKTLSRVVLPSALAAFLGLGMIGCASSTEPTDTPPRTHPKSNPSTLRLPSQR